MRESAAEITFVKPVMVDTDVALPLVGVGGIGSAEQAYEKIRAGASAVHVYSAMVYAGLSSYTFV